MLTHPRLTLATLTILAASALAVGVRSTAVEKSAAAATGKATSQAATKTAAEPAPRNGYKSVLIRDVPHVRQKPDFCGEAATASWLQAIGRPADQDYVFDQSGLDPLAARGCHTKELSAALKKIGFQIGSVWYKIPVAAQAAALESQWRATHADLARGVPSIICMHYDERPNTTEHFRLILGYDADSDEVIYHEPAEAGGAYRRMKRAVLLKLWPLKYGATEWTVIRMPLAGDKIAAVAASNTFTAADYAQHLMKLKRKIPSEDFNIIIQHPFVVIGDESPAMVKRRAEGTVKWAVDRLKEAYFAKDPNEILDIWLFKDKTSYRKHTKEVFNYRPDTPYGYFSHVDKALVMNIATGGGTLVHEIVHPFVASNFPDCPAWLNEGLGSLYEQSSSRRGQIVGLTNWRLAGLQAAIRRGGVPSFKMLCSTTDNEFYNRDSGTNYAQARYLCYYLQEHNLLRKFYHAFHANRRNDPTGYGTLVETLGKPDMAKFQKDWEAYALKLRFP